MQGHAAPASASASSLSLERSMLAFRGTEDMLAFFNLYDAADQFKFARKKNQKLRSTFANYVETLPGPPMFPTKPSSATDGGSNSNDVTMGGAQSAATTAVAVAAANAAALQALNQMVHEENTLLAPMLAVVPPFNSEVPTSCKFSDVESKALTFGPSAPLGLIPADDPISKKEKKVKKEKKK